MAEDPTAAETNRGEVPLIVDDGNSNTIVLLEDDGNGGNAAFPDSGTNSPAAGPGLTVVVAERDPTTGDVTLVEGKSTEGDGRIQIAGTGRIFDDQAAFEEFLAEVNAKADAGVPFEDIIGNDVNAIPIVENGVATGATLGGLEEGPAPGEVVQVGSPPAANGNAGASPEPAAGNGAFSSEPGESARRDPSENRDPDSNGSPANPSANGEGQTNPFGDRNTNDAVDQLRGEEEDPNGPLDPDPDVRQPGRDDNGNLLPGADGRVTLDDFNEINDRDGDGINDGAGTLVDLAGDPEDEAPRFDSPPLRQLDPEPPAFEAPTPGLPFEPGGDGTPELPAPLPGPPLAAEDPFLPGDGLAVVREPDAPVEAAPAGPVNLPPVTLPETPAVDVPPPAAAPPSYVIPAVAIEDPEVAHAAAPAAADSQESPVAHAAVAPPAVAPLVHPAADLDTFSHGTAPNNPPPAVTAPESTVATAGPSHEGEAAVDAFTQVEVQHYPHEAAPDAAAANVSPVASGVAVGAALAASGAPRSATDVFDPAAAASATGEADDGGGNLLERILDKVKDVLFDSGSSEASPVQLPVQPETATAELTEVATQVTNQPAALADRDDSPLPEDTLDDGL